MNNIQRYFYKNILIIFYLCDVFGHDSLFSNNHNVTEDFVSKVYVLYKKAIENDANFSSPRRFYKDDKEYVVHVQKLKEVNGLKNHNLAVKDKRLTKKSLIYINNPVESKIPNAFLTVEEFKAALLGRINNQREQFENFKRVIAKVDKSSSNKEKWLKKDRIAKKIALNNVVNKHYVPRVPNITIFHDQYVNVTVEVRDKIESTTLLSQDVSNVTDITTEKVEYAHSISETVDTAVSSNVDIKTERTSISTDVTNKSTLKTILTTKKLSELRILKENTNNATEITEETTPELLDTTDNVEETTEASTEEENSVSEVNNSSDETESATVTTTKITRKTRGRPFVFLGEGYG